MSAAPQAFESLGFSLSRVFGLLLAVLLCATPALAYTTSSPEVRKLKAAGMQALGKLSPDSRLGGKAVVAIALHKGGQPDHPRVAEAVKACREAAVAANELDVYSHGLAMILLTTVDPDLHRNELQYYINAMAERQKPHGGWGYDGRDTGDTSQTQYMALALWELYYSNIKFDRQLPLGMIKWLHATQGPEGEWGYQGQLAQGSKLVKQAGVTRTMGAAAMGSLMIGADLFGRVRPRGGGPQSDLPSGLRLSSGSQSNSLLNSSGVDWERWRSALSNGETWMQNNPEPPPKRYANYYLYALERYHSLREYRLGLNEKEPDWYTEGVEYLIKNQVRPGVWESGCDEPSDTAFAVLFLLRATQKSIRLRIGEGSLVSGRGLPKNLAGAKLKGGTVFVELDDVSVGDFLSALNRADAEQLDSLTQDPSAIIVGELTEKDIQQLEQLLRGGKPPTRRVAATALGRTGNLDRAPVLLYALTDPDRQVALAARDALRFISRKTLGYGMPDNFTDEQRYEAVERWRRWYLGLRPNAVIDLEG